MSNGCNTGQDLKSLRGKMPAEPIVVTDLCVKVGCDVLTCVTKTTTFTAKGKLSYTSETVYTDKDGNVLDGAVETNCPMKVEIVGSNAEDEITLKGEDCDGVVVEASGIPGQIVHAVQAPGTVFTVKMCPTDSADFELSCGKDPATGHQIQTAYQIVAGQFVVINRWDTVTGLAWTGDPATLEGCGGSSFAAQKELFCDNGVEFFRWYVIENGAPNGQYFDTDKQSNTYTVTNEAGIKVGPCVAATTCLPTVSSAPANTLAGLLPGNTVSIQKGNCCSLKVTTSAGAFILSKEVTGYSTSTFNCAVTVTGVEILSGSCNLADVIVTTQFSG